MHTTLLSKQSLVRVPQAILEIVNQTSIFLVLLSDIDAAASGPGFPMEVFPDEKYLVSYPMAQAVAPFCT